MIMYIIDDNTPVAETHGTGFGRGYDPATVEKDPAERAGYAAPPSQINMVPRSEWSARCRERTQLKSGLRFLRDVAADGQRIPSLDQNGQGFCWAYSTGMALMMARAKAGQPYVRLSPHAVACKIKNFRDEGGWCGLSAKFARENGYPDESVWPQKSMSRSNDTTATWENAARHKVTMDFVDLSQNVYDQNLTEEQVASVFLNSEGPVMLDFNWWSHSVCGLDIVEVEPGSFGFVILNSWTDQWGEAGIAVLRGSKMRPDGAVSIRAATPG